MGEDAPSISPTTRHNPELLSSRAPADFNNPFEEFGFLEGLRRHHARPHPMLTKRALAIYSPQEQFPLWKLGRDSARIDAIQAQLDRDQDSVARGHAHRGRCPSRYVEFFSGCTGIDAEEAYRHGLVTRAEVDALSDEIESNLRTAGYRVFDNKPGITSCASDPTASSCDGPTGESSGRESILSCSNPSGRRPARDDVTACGAAEATPVQEAEDSLFFVGSSPLCVGNRRLGVGNRRLGVGSSPLCVGNRRLGVGSSPLCVGNRHLGVGNRRLRVGSSPLCVGNRRLRVGNRRPGVGSGRLGVGNRRLGVGSGLLRRDDHRLRVRGGRPALEGRLQPVGATFAPGTRPRPPCGSRGDLQV